MATRLYLPDTIAGYVTPPAPSGTDWEHVNSSVRSLLRGPDGSTLTNLAYTPDGADDLTSKDSHFRQYVSEPLLAQTLSGNVTGQLQCIESNAGNNLFLTLKVLVCDNSGSSTVATLLAITRATSLEVATSLTNRTFPSTAITSTAVSQGDRLVIEIGLGGTPTAAGGTQGHNGTIRFGCSASSGDLPVDETQTGTTYRPWIEFSGNFTWFTDTMTAVTNAQHTVASGMQGLRWL